MSRAQSGRGFSADMEIDVLQQALTLLSAFLLGAALGLGYDLLRPLRRRSRGVLTALIDVVFALGAGVLAFVFAMGAANGRLGVWELTFTLAGFLVYLYTLSRRVYPIMDGGMKIVCVIAKKIKKFFQKNAEMAKFLFQKVRECFIIKKE